MYGGSIDLPLNNLGRQQLAETAEKIKATGAKITKIYTSPMSRAKDSAKVLAEILGLKDAIIVEPDLIDSLIPAVAGKPVATREEIHSKGTDEYDEEFVKKGNEAREHIADRMQKVFEKVANENQGKTVAIVSHADPLRLLLYRLENPGKKAPFVFKLLDNDLINKGQAMKLVVDDKNKILEKKAL